MTEILTDSMYGFIGEFTLTETINGKSEIIVQEKNMIVNRSKQSLAQMLAGAKMAELGNVYNIQPINRFELGSGSHSGLTKLDPDATYNQLRARTNYAGNTVTTPSAQIYRIDFDPFQTGVANTGGPNGTTLTQINGAYVKEFDNNILFGGTNNIPISTGVYPSVVKMAYGEATDATGTYKNAILYEITIPEERANQDAVAFSTTNPVYYSEAGLFVRKGDLDTTYCSFDMFAMKTFPPRPKASDAKWTISWKIIF